MKNNKGISMITLIVMIIIMIILASITINVSTKSYQESIETKMQAEREQVKKAIAGRFGAYQRNSTGNPLVGILIPEENLDTTQHAVEYICDKFKKEYGKSLIPISEDSSDPKQLLEKFVSDNFDDMEYTRILVPSDLIDLGIENTNLNAVYLVNYYSTDVVGPIN